MGAILRVHFKSTRNREPIQWLPMSHTGICNISSSSENRSRPLRTRRCGSVPPPVTAVAVTVAPADTGCASTLVIRRRFLLPRPSLSPRGSIVHSPYTSIPTCSFIYIYLYTNKNNMYVYV